MTNLYVVVVIVHSQSLTSNNNNGIVCPGQDVEYTCSSNLTRILSWTSPLVLAGMNNPNTNTMNLQVTSVFNSSGTTSVLIIRYSKDMNATNVTCLSGLSSVSLLYYPIHGK